jgi:hypothetical protein
VNSVEEHYYVYDTRENSHDHAQPSKLETKEYLHFIENKSSDNVEYRCLLFNVSKYRQKQLL